MSSHLTALELLELGDSDREKTFLNKVWPTLVGVVFGVSAGCMMNFGVRRPLFSGIQNHVLLAGGITGVLHFAQMKRDEYYAEKDAVMRHYVELHPEDFPAPERKKIGEIFEEWTPIR